MRERRRHRRARARQLLVFVVFARCATFERNTSTAHGDKLHGVAESTRVAALGLGAHIWWNATVYLVGRVALG